MEGSMETLNAACHSVTVGLVERTGSEYRRREVRSSKPGDVQSIKALFSTAEAVKNPPFNLHHHMGRGRLFVKLYCGVDNQVPSSVLEIRNGLVYEGSRLIARMSDEAIDALRALVADAETTVVRP